jgi:polygalacturonase
MNITATTATQDVVTVEGGINNDEFGMQCVVCLECKNCAFSNTLIETHRHLSLDLIDPESGATFSAEYMP